VVAALNVGSERVADDSGKGVFSQLLTELAQVLLILAHRHFHQKYFFVFMDNFQVKFPESEQLPL